MAPLLAALLGAAAPVAAAPSPTEAFVAGAFAGAPPAPTVLWYDPARRAAVTRILGHPPSAARVRLWTAAGRTAVVLDEVAHTLPITAGFVVAGGRLERAEVLVYRETRGAAVRQKAWLAKLEGRTLGPAGALDPALDGISGATLSVAALDRMARLALFLAAEAAADAPR